MEDSNTAVGKTVVSSSIIDRIARSLRRPLMQVPVGFKWFSQGLLDGTLCFAGEECAGASFLERGGLAWTTDKDGIVMDLLAAELTERALLRLEPGLITESALAGEAILAKLTRAPGNAAPLGGITVIATSGWFAARPSGIENLYELYAESFRNPAHLDAIVREAREIVDRALRPVD